MSRWPMAMVAANRAVTAPTVATIARRHRRQLEEGAGAGNQVDTGGHHGGGVDEGRDRRRALHGVGQPHVERQLSRLAGSADQQKKRDGGGFAGGQQIGGLLEDDVVRERAEGGEDQHQRDQEAEVADPVDDERLLAGRRRRRLLEPERDQQVGAEPDQFPPDEQHGEVVGQHQDQHRGDEQVEVGEEPAESRVAVHVADRVDMDEESDSGDDEGHHRRQRVPQERGVDAEARDPVEEIGPHRLALAADHRQALR